MKKFDNVERKKRQKSVRSREEQENNGRLGEKKQGMILGLKKKSVERFQLRTAAAEAAQPDAYRDRQGARARAPAPHRIAGARTAAAAAQAAAAAASRPRTHGGPATRQPSEGSPGHCTPPGGPAGADVAAAAEENNAARRVPAGPAGTRAARRVSTPKKVSAVVVQHQRDALQDPDRKVLLGREIRSEDEADAHGVPPQRRDVHRSS